MTGILVKREKLDAKADVLVEEVKRQTGRRLCEVRGREWSASEPPGAQREHRTDLPRSSWKEQTLPTP